MAFSFGRLTYIKPAAISTAPASTPRVSMDAHLSVGEVFGKTELVFLI